MKKSSAFVKLTLLGSAALAAGCGGGTPTRQVQTMLPTNSTSEKREDEPQPDEWTSGTSVPHQDHTTTHRSGSSILILPGFGTTTTVRRPPLPGTGPRPGITNRPGSTVVMPGTTNRPGSTVGTSSTGSRPTTTTSSPSASTTRSGFGSTGASTSGAS